MDLKEREKLFESAKVRTISFAKRRSTNVRHLRQDIIQVALTTLWEMTEKFDPSKGIKFSSYALHRIGGAILDFIALSRHDGRQRNGQKKLDFFKMVSFNIGKSEEPNEQTEPIPVNDDPLDKELRAIDVRDAMNDILKTLDYPTDFIMKAWIDEEPVKDTAVKVGRSEACVSQYRLKIKQIIRARLPYLMTA